MECVFGTKGEIEVLKTKGREHSNLTGFQEMKQEYPDQTVTDRFRVVRKIDSQKDVEGNCYDWYEIDRHYRMVDKASPILNKLAQDVAAIEDALCEMDTSGIQDAEEE